MVYNMKSNTYLFRAMPPNCTDNGRCRQMLLTAVSRLEKLRSLKYGGQLDSQCFLQIMKLYRELRCDDYVAAYARLRHIGTNTNLCSSEMTAILVPTLKYLMEGNAS